MDSGGFWICYCPLDSASFGIKISSIPISSRFNPSTARLYDSSLLRLVDFFFFLFHFKEMWIATSANYRMKREEPSNMRENEPI